MKLLTIKIVANSFFGFSSNLITDCFLLDLFAELSSKSVLDNEKKATSEPDIKAEIISNTNREIIPKTNGQFKEEIIKNKLEGPGSNYTNLG